MAPEQNSNDELPPEVMQALRAGHKVEAIKRLRRARGIGLKEAKDAVDAVSLSVAPHPPDTMTVRRDSRGGIAKLFLLLLAVGLALAAYVYLGGGTGRG